MATSHTVPAVAEFLDDATQRRIHYRVARLGHKFALSREDREDLRQDFRMALLSAQAQYAPDKCPLDRFVSMVLNRRYKYHVRQLCQLSHHRGRTPNAMALDDVDPDVDCLIPDPRQEAALAQVELRHDLRHAFKGMTDIERGVCALLMSGHTPTEASRMLGVVPSTVTRAMDRIRGHLSRAGLDPSA
jgi:DNA-directed RNA polymerase specialized sigma24 family protein